MRTEAGVPGGWHHHGQRDSSIYVVRGTITIEFGPGGREHLTGRAGDFIFNPAGLIHRELTSPNEAAEIFLIRIGQGPLTINVDRPEPDAP